MTSKKDTEDPKTNGSEEEEENEDEEEKEEITYTKAALFGKMDFEYPRTARVVRIYIHSAGKGKPMATSTHSCLSKCPAFLMRHFSYEFSWVDILCIDSNFAQICSKVSN